MAERRESNISALNVKVNMDCSEALKGLKAVTRAAKKATAALKELEPLNSKKVLFLKSKVRLSKEAQIQIIEQVKNALNNGEVLLLDDNFEYEWIYVPSNFDVELTDEC